MAWARIWEKKLTGSAGGYSTTHRREPGHHIIRARPGLTLPLPTRTSYAEGRKRKYDARWDRLFFEDIFFLLGTAYGAYEGACWETFPFPEKSKLYKLKYSE